MADFKSGESYDRLHRCITINIIASGMTFNNNVHTEYVIAEKETHKPLTDVLEIHFLSLQAAKRIKGSAEKQKKLINWLKFIETNNKKERAMLAESSPVLQLLNEKLDVLTLDPIEKKLYESRMKLKSDIVTISESQFKAGIEQGAQRKAFETAKAFKKQGIPLETIAEGTGLSKEEIERL